MRVLLILSLGITLLTNTVFAQRECRSAEYQQEVLLNNALARKNASAIEDFVQQQLRTFGPVTAGSGGESEEHSVIKIPVVFHILYHVAGENISEKQILDQLDVLNQCYRRRQQDSANTPQAFKSLAADVQIEFRLAVSDSKKRPTTGIIRKYTPVIQWRADDLIKSSAQMGDDAWDAGSYLNIWVCNMRGVAGFSSLPGGPADKDGIVLDYSVVGLSSKPGYELGKTAVHEVGHWLGLKHIWGDSDCGDDMVGDTPRQSSYTIGCPKGIKISCGNGANGNMYMNYMDLTGDMCTNLFTQGQKARMRSSFAYGGPRYSVLLSTGLQPALNGQLPLPEESPKWLYPQLYPNPATNELTIDISYDPRWIGKALQVISSQGRIELQTTITSKIQKIDISRFTPGIYFISAKKEDGQTIRQKIIKM